MKRYFAAASQHAVSPTAESAQAVQERMAAAYSKIDKAVKRGVLHPNTAARRKARLAKALKSQAATSASSS